MVKEKVIDTKELAIEIARVLAFERCREVVVMDVSKITDITDCIVIATGLNKPQMRAAMSRVTEWCKAHDQRPLESPDRNTERWMLLDFGHVMVHLFVDEWRKYYDLEMLWGEGEPVDWQAGLPELATGRGPTLVS